MRLYILLIGFICQMVHAQVGINTTTPDASSLLDVSSTSKGVLIPRLSQTQMNGISNPAKGLLIFNTTASALYYYNGTKWISREDRKTAMVNAGTAVQLDNIRAMVSTTTNQRSLMIATASGNINISGTSQNRYLGAIPASGGATGTLDGWVRQTDNLGTGFVHFQPGAHFPAHGAVQIIKLMDETNSQAYEIELIVGSSWLNNMISIKRIL